jgi:hypothetical protein
MKDRLLLLMAQNVICCETPIRPESGAKRTSRRHRQSVEDDPLEKSTFEICRSAQWPLKGADSSGVHTQTSSKMVGALCAPLMTGSLNCFAQLASIISPKQKAQEAALCAKLSHFVADADLTFGRIRGQPGNIYDKLPRPFNSRRAINHIVCSRRRRAENNWK